MRRITGHQRVIDVLQRAIASDRVHHCWIFSGPRGVGKHTTAVEFARLLLDPEAGPNLAGEFESPPESAASRFVDAGTHPDLHLVRKELALFSDNAQLRNRKLANLPVDVLREHVIGGKTSDDRVIDGPAYRTAQLGHGKVFIIDEAELLDTVGQNALLKTLEEPPPRTYLILVTSRAERLLPTILSRSQHVRFGTLSDDEMAVWLGSSDLDLGDEAARAWILRYADGAPGVAKIAGEYGFHDWWTTIAAPIDQLWRGGFPAALGAMLAELIEAFAVAWVKRNENASKDAANKDGASHLLSILAHTARERIHSCQGDELEHALRVVDVIRDAEQSLRSNVNLKQVLEDLVAQWAMSRSSARPVGA